MTVLTTTFSTLGGLLLTHAYVLRACGDLGFTEILLRVYSAYEHSLLTTTASTISTSALQPSSLHHALPIDIVAETMLSTLLLTLAIISAAPALRPIHWNEWAGKIEREGWDPHADSNLGEVVEGTSGLDDGNGNAKGGVGNPYRALEERRAFWDVRVSLVITAVVSVRHAGPKGRKGSGVLVLT